MSNVLYPVSLVAKSTVTPFNRVIRDEFENGNTSARLAWTSYFFKRRFQIEHAPFITESEYRVLSSFFTQRNGTYDTFWYRDNVNRGGNAKVRFAEPLPWSKEKMVWATNVELEESAALRVMPEVEEITTAAGVIPKLWWDANRLRYYEHPTILTGVGYKEETLFDATLNGWTGTWQAGTAPTPGDYLAQWQYVPFDGTRYARSASVTALSGAKPGLTCFFFAKAPTEATLARMFVMIGGGTGAACAGGWGLSTANQFRLYDGASFVGTGYTNPVSTWKSYAFALDSGADTYTTWENGANALTGSFTARSVASYEVSFGATFAGAGGVVNNTAMQHLLLFNSVLTTPQVLAVHNLLKYHVGL